MTKEQMAKIFGFENSEPSKIREYNEESNVEIVKHGNGRFIVVAYNEGGFKSTAVDLIDLLEWAWINMPDEILKAKEVVK